MTNESDAPVVRTYDDDEAMRRVQVEAPIEKLTLICWKCAFETVARYCPRCHARVTPGPQWDPNKLVRSPVKLTTAA